MLVADFKVKSISSARFKDFKTYELIINGISITSNLPCLEVEEGLIQIDVCDECFTVGCASGGYVQAFLIDKLVIWKEPLVQDKDPYKVNQYRGSYGLKFGTIYWSIEKYKEFLDIYDVSMKNEDIFAADFLDINQARDLWRIYGSKCYMPNSLDSLSIEWLEEQFLSMYSEEKNNDECLTLYKGLKAKWDKGKKVTIVNLADDVIKVTVIFDVVQGYREWDFISYKGDKLYFPIGDGFALEIQ